MKKTLILFSLAVLIFAFSACGEKFDSAEDYVDRIYTYEGEGCGGDFSVVLNEDGTFSYYEGFLSSYIGFGTWTSEGEIITLSDDPEFGYELVNRFRMKNGDLVYVSEGSSGFIYVDVLDGEEFHGGKFDPPKNTEE